MLPIQLIYTNVSKFQFSFLVGLTCALSAYINFPAAALPGQTGGEVIQWSEVVGRRQHLTNASLCGTTAYAKFRLIN